MLNKQQIEFYNENGYVIPNFQLSEEIINEISDHCNRLLIKNPEFKDFCPNGLQVEGKNEIRTIVTGVTASQALIDAAIEKKSSEETKEKQLPTS